MKTRIYAAPAVKGFKRVITATCDWQMWHVDVSCRMHTWTTPANVRVHYRDTPYSREPHSRLECLDIILEVKVMPEETDPEHGRGYDSTNPVELWPASQKRQIPGQSKIKVHIITSVSAPKPIVSTKMKQQ